MTTRVGTLTAKQTKTTASVSVEIRYRDRSIERERERGRGRMDYLAKAKVIDNALGCRRSLEQCFDLLNVQEKTLSFIFF